jgi:hypothetical protein
MLDWAKAPLASNAAAAAAAGKIILRIGDSFLFSPSNGGKDNGGTGAMFIRLSRRKAGQSDMAANGLLAEQNKSLLPHPNSYRLNRRHSPL